jgi:hypothetical protein
MFAVFVTEHVINLRHFLVICFNEIRFNIRFEYGLKNLDLISKKMFAVFVTEHVISLTHFLVMCFNKVELEIGFEYGLKNLNSYSKR